MAHAEFGAQPHAVEAEFGHAGGGALLGSVLALAGELLAARWLLDAIVGNGAAPTRGGGVP